MEVEGITPRTTLSSIAGWKLGRTLGRGAYAHVRLATHPNGHQAACKILPALHRPRTGLIPWDETMDAIEAHKEVVLLKALAGAGLKGIVGLEGVIEEGGWTYVFLTLYDRSASTITSDRSEDRPIVIRFFRRLCRIIHALHLLGISHEDLKRSNILVDKDGHPVVVDFGFSHFRPNGELVRSSGGTLDYSSPEKVQDLYYNAAANDVWALGVLLVKLLNLPHPFAAGRGANATDALKIKICGFPPNLDRLTGDPWATAAKDLLKKIFNKDPLRRLTIPQILAHRALQGVGPDLPEFEPPPLRLPPDLPQRIPRSVWEDVCFLAHVNKEFFFCETTKRIKDKVSGPGECWEKRWVGFLSKWSQKEELSSVVQNRDPRMGHAMIKGSLSVPRPLQAIHLSPNIPQNTVKKTGAVDTGAAPNAVREDKENSVVPTRKPLIGQMKGKDGLSETSMRSHISVKPLTRPPAAPRAERIIKTPARVDFGGRSAVATKTRPSVAAKSSVGTTKLTEQRTKSHVRAASRRGSSSSSSDNELKDSRDGLVVGANRVREGPFGETEGKKTKIASGAQLATQPGRRSQRLLEKVWK